MKIGVSSYCFHRLTKEGKFTLFDAIEYTKKTGFDVIEFSDFTAPQGKSLEEFAGELAKACKGAGLEICNYATQADFLNSSEGNNSSEGDINKEVQRLKKRVDIAKILGAPMMRHDAS